MIADSKCLLKKFASVQLAEDIHYLNIKLHSSLFYEYRYDGKLCLASLKGTLSEEAIFFLIIFQNKSLMCSHFHSTWFLPDVTSLKPLFTEDQQHAKCSLPEHYNGSLCYPMIICELANFI